MPRIEEVVLSFESLADLDEGRINKLLLHHLQRIAHDCLSRPADKTARKVILEFAAKPILDPDDGSCEAVKFEIEARSKVPVYRSRQYEMRVTNKGFLFNRDFPDAVDQQPLFEKED